MVGIEQSARERTDTHETFSMQYTPEGSPMKHVVRCLRFVAKGACMDSGEWHKLRWSGERRDQR
jgi:hypothetical protein